MILRKANVLAQLEVLRQTAETEHDAHFVMTAILELLLTYNNDPEIRAAVDAIPF